MSDSILCPKCSSQYTYQYEVMYICPECGYEWAIDEKLENSSENEILVYDVNKNLLSEGDFVTLVKDLKVKGSSSILKVGTKVKISRFIDGDHNIDCKIDGLGSMMLKSEFVKKAKTK